ncbi:restriction endonuclease [Maridesulfovibrio sp.]|uniref:restriction endonuclease n=1 Tax=Maridesulfovibrio sp. TaxID=2795000 RepID=UPI003AFF851C
MQVWAFSRATEEHARKLVYESILKGKSRFGWSQEDDHNLKLTDRPTDWDSRQQFLLRVQKGDWIVHINTPKDGQCIAARVISEYEFDEGVQCDWGPDFRHNFTIDVGSIVEFARNDSNVLPSVNLYPRQRQQRIYEVEDFLESLENLQNSRVTLVKEQERSEFHLKRKTNPYLSELTRNIQKMHPAKQLEVYLAKVFRRLPDVVEVEENGSGWKTDYGADLIVTTQSNVAGLSFRNKIIVQIKSYAGEHYDLNAVEQIKIGIEKFDATAGIIITTARSTEQLENRVQEVSYELDKQISLLAGEAVAKFVLKHAPELIFNLDI